MNSVLHKTIGDQYKLFIFDAETPGQVILLPKGFKMLKLLQDIVDYQLKVNNYSMVSSPTFGSKKIWDKTKHSCKYEDNMFSIDDNYYLKPMNCPMHMLIASHMYANSSIFPLKLSEFNYCFRKESSGSLSGLFRLLRFTQDDSHVLCNLSQVEDIIGGFFNMLNILYKKLGFENCIKFRLSTLDDNYIGDLNQKNESESILRNYLIKNSFDFFEEKDGAFYGPKIDILLTDSHNREWQTGTIQIDFCLLRNINFSLQNKHTYENSLVIHHAVLGTFERFLAILLEHHGKIPSIINPYKVKILSVRQSEKMFEYKTLIDQVLAKNSLTDIVDFDFSTIDLRSKNKHAYELGYEYIIVVGEEEASTVSLSVTDCLQSKKYKVNLTEFFEQLNKSIYEQKYNI